MRVAVLASGSGTNLQALLDAQAQNALHPAELALVLCNRPGALALDRAARAGIAHSVVDHTLYASRRDFEEALLTHLREHDIEAVVLAGFMRILSSFFVEQFPHRILNTHPALCPAFPGVQAPRQAIEAGVKVSGCTVHFVDQGVDTGPIIFQEAVDVLADDTPERLHRRIQKLEHKLLPEATRLLAAGKLEVLQGRVRLP